MLAILALGAGEVTHAVPTLGELAEADEEEDAAAEALIRPAADVGGLQQCTLVLGGPAGAATARAGASAHLRQALN